MNSTDKAYIAGFIDADGTIMIRKQQVYKKTIHIYPEVSIHNTCKTVLESIQKLTGGRLICVKPNPDRIRRKKLFRLKYNKKECIKILKNIIPYLKIKKKHGILCLELFQTYQKEITRDNRGRIKPLAKDILKKRYKIWEEFKEAQKEGKHPFKGVTIKRW